MQVSLVPPDHIDAVWAEVKPWLEPAVAVTNGRYTTQDVHRLLAENRLTLWIAFDDSGIHGCQVTQIIDYPSRRVLGSLFTAGRRLRQWREPMMSVLLRWAADTDCTAIEGQGREGWIKLLEPYGCRITQICFERDV